MKRFPVAAICCLLFACLFTGGSVVWSAEPAAFANIPLLGSEQDCQLTGGCNKDYHASLADLDGEFILVEIFSMYCPICQGAAPNVNTLYELIQKSPAAGRFLLVGAGADNSRYEVDFFRKKYAIPFALLADPELQFYNSSGADGTPYFLLLQKNASGTLKTLYTHSGKFENPESFFNLLLQKADLAG